MPAPSPAQSADAIINVRITANGQPLDADIQVESIDVWAGVNRLPTARLVLLDGDAADQNFAISETAALIPGAILTIALGYGDGQMTVFAGVIHGQGLEITANTPTRRVVEAADKAVAMTLTRASAVFPNVTDSEVCQKLITQAGLTAQVTPTCTVHETIVQYDATSWDLMMMRAQLNGMVVTVDKGAVAVEPPNTHQEPKLTLTHGESLLAFHAHTDASTQPAKTKGKARFQGSALVTPGCLVRLAGLGDRFNGDAYVSAVHHSVAEGSWNTSVEIGLARAWSAETAPKIAAQGGSTQPPPINGLQTAIVAQIGQDPDGEFRVFVRLPLLQSDTGVWARFGSYYASKGTGSCFYPEIGDEVVVAFLGGDPRYPVILGSLYSKANPSPAPPEATNNIKTIMSRSKMKVEFDEDLRQISLTTPAGQSVILSDSEQSITASDANGNSIKMNANGVGIHSALDMAISASGSITLTAQVALAATGKASVKLTSDGPVEVAGATVALNP
jgi:phage protein D/phage baseplate assembly protein gpV